MLVLESTAGNFTFTREYPTLNPPKRAHFCMVAIGTQLWMFGVSRSFLPV